MQYNKLSGSTIDTTTSILFKEFDNENFYLGFARQAESWGNCALINISLNDTTIDTVIANVAGVDDKFTDKNVTSAVDTQLRVYLYKTTQDVPDFDSDLTLYTKITELETFDLKLQYINSNWCIIKGLPPNYVDFTNTTDKFYIIRNNNSLYGTNPDNISAVAKINIKSELDSSINTETVVLKIVDTGVESTVISNLNLVTNMLGEIIVDGLQTLDASTEDLLTSYAIDSTTPVEDLPYFMLRKSMNQSSIIFSTMYLMKTQTEDGEDTIWHYSSYDKYLLFRVSNQFEQNFYIKISNNPSTSGIAIYHETLPYEINTSNSINNISDANPPALDSTYIRNQGLHDSIFDVLGFVKIKRNQLTEDLSTDLYSKISYVKEMRNENEKLKYINSYGFEYSETASKRIDDVSITSNEVVVHYGNIRKNPHTIDGNYTLPVSRLYLYSNNFVIGDTITIRYWDGNIQNKNSSNEALAITGVSYQEDNYYIELNGTTIGAIIFDELAPTEDATSALDATIISDPTYTVIKIEYAVCDSYLDATKYNMNRVMIDMKLPSVKQDLYSDIYRQLIVTHLPKFNNLGTMTQCTADLYTGSLFDFSKHKYDVGTVVFLANKSPIYRKYLVDKEIFKLII